MLCLFKSVRIIYWCPDKHSISSNFFCFKEYTNIMAARVWAVVFFIHRAVVCPQLHITKSKQHLLFVMLLTPPPVLPHRPSQRTPEHSRAATCCVWARRGREVSLHTTEYLLCLLKLSGESMNGRMKLNKEQFTCGYLSINHPTFFSLCLFVCFVQMRHWFHVLCLPLSDGLFFHQ